MALVAEVTTLPPTGDPTSGVGGSSSTTTTTCKVLEERHEQQIVGYDELDAQALGTVYSAVVLDANGDERPPWTVFCLKIPRSLALFVIIIVAIVIIMGNCCYRLTAEDAICEETTIYCMILSSLVTFFLPSPLPKATVQ